MMLISSFKQENNDQYLSWLNFKDQFIEKHTFIDDITVEGTGPTLIINIRMKKQMDLNEIEYAFNELRNETIEVYQDLEEMHQKKYGGISKMSICFYINAEDRGSAYIFTAFKDKSDKAGFEEFSNWMLEHNGEIREYTP